jgi:hypothetical protein
MISYFDKHILAFVDEWGNKVLPQLEHQVYWDATEVFMTAKKNRMIQNSLTKGERVYIVGFRGCKGMIDKWLYDEHGRMIREQGRGIVAINSSVITMSTVDINVPFMTSDEVLLPKRHSDKPYSLERELVESAMREFGFDSAQDMIFIFLVKPSEAEPTILRFVSEFRHIITKEYCRAKGIVAIKDPKWKKYHMSDEVTQYTDAFFFSGVRLIYSSREAEKSEIGRSDILA